MGGSKKQKETWAEKEMGRIGREKWEHYKKNYMPLEADYIARMTEDGTHLNRSLGMDNADSVQAWDDATGREIDTTLQRGADPTSGNFVSTVAGMGDSRGRSMGNRRSDIHQQSRDEHASNMMKATAIGVGRSADSVNTLRQVGGLQAQHQAADVNSRNAKTAGRYQAAGQAIGAGMGAWAQSSATNQADARWQGYNDQRLDGGQWSQNAAGTWVNSKGVQ